MPSLPDWLGWLLLVAVFALAVAWWRANTRVGRHNRARQGVARIGEDAAERLLEDHGYTILDRQLTRTWTLWVDGEPCEVRSRADLLVSKRGLEYIAEVKTGSRAPDPTIPATRRQLMEYHFVFPVAGVLLVDAEAGRVHEVHWQDPGHG